MRLNLEVKGNMYVCWFKDSTDSNNLVSKKTALCIDPVPRKMQNATAMNGGGRWTVELNGSARAGTILSAVPLSLYYFYITTWGFPLYS